MGCSSSKPKPQQRYQPRAATQNAPPIHAVVLVPNNRPQSRAPRQAPVAAPQQAPVAAPRQVPTAPPVVRPKFTMAQLLPNYEKVKEMLSTRPSFQSADDEAQRIVMSIEHIFGPGEYLAIEFETNHRTGQPQYDIKLYSKDGSEYYDMNYTVQPDFYSKPAHKPRRPIVNPVFPFTFDEVYGN